MKKKFTDSKINKTFKKSKRKKISILTCYDSSFSAILDKSKIDAILVGDSFANVCLGLKTTKEISFKEMFNHTKAVVLNTSKIVIADMPYVAYQKDKKKALYYAEKFIADAGADAVKLEWFDGCLEVTRNLIKRKIPVMGHIGLTPQNVKKIGGFKVQGKNIESAVNLLDQAKRLSDLGVFSLVLECVPEKISKIITDSVKMVTIGCGGGKYCDGQVLVLYDILGLYPGKRPRFVRQYADLSDMVVKITNNFVEDIKKNKFPDSSEIFSIDPKELARIRKFIRKS